ncbi:hypothetical protein P280DRAFT_496398 [Massarina eburnea CBS 473.64]|uniref:Pheromone alpha factor receptor n=1 Tax=Massarina eburnea CBS 473.64 TaxID=1395130 RepID=A0A6A6S812_9PLEO|nr:hypothetical protein P280DRAFT_496398 [Massarina eburnea CBS 473.64]
MSNVTVDPNLDRWTQNFTLIGSDGHPFETNMGDFDFMRKWGIRLAINWASQIGASIILLLVLLLLTKRDRRKSAVFIINALCLVLNCTRLIVQSTWLTTDYYHPYSVVANDYSRVTKIEYGNTVATNCLVVVLIACIMISLSLQVWVVCVTIKPLHRLIIMSVTTFMALVAIGFRFAVSVLINIQSAKNETMSDYINIVNDMYITQAVAVWLYCCVFTFKLGQAIVQRRKMRMDQFGPMQVIFIMGCQTMTIPAIFTSLQFYEEVPELASQGTTIICIFLPLSAIWAGLVANDASVAVRGPDGHQRLLQGEFYHASTNASKNSEKNTILSSSTYSSSGKESTSPNSPRHAKNLSDDGIYVGKNWSVTEEGEASTTHNAYV